MKTIRKYFLAGLATIVPVAITAFLLYAVWDMGERWVGDRINAVLIEHLGLY